MSKPKIQTTYTLVVTHGKEENKEENVKYMDMLLKHARVGMNYRDSKNALSWKIIN